MRLYIDGFQQVDITPYMLRTKSPWDHNARLLCTYSQGKVGMSGE